MRYVFNIFGPVQPKIYWDNSWVHQETLQAFRSDRTNPQVGRSARESYFWNSAMLLCKGPGSFDNSFQSSSASPASRRNSFTDPGPKPAKWLLKKMKPCLNRLDFSSRQYTTSASSPPDPSVSRQNLLSNDRPPSADKPHQKWPRAEPMHTGSRTRPG